jgi:hypothetical protein
LRRDPDGCPGATSAGNLSNHARKLGFRLAYPA